MHREGFAAHPAAPLCQPGTGTRVEFGPAGQGWAKNSSVSDSAGIEALPFSGWFIFSLFPRLSAAWDKGEQGLDPSRSPPGKKPGAGTVKLVQIPDVDALRAD